MKIKKIEELKKQLSEIRGKNNQLRENWKVENEKHYNKILDFNEKQKILKVNYENADEQLTYFVNLKKSYRNFVDLEGFKKFVETLPKPQQEKPLVNLPEPEYISTIEIENKIESAQEQQIKHDIINS